MRTFNVIVERDPETGLDVGHVPGWPGAHSQGSTLDELEQNLREVIEMLLEDGDPNWFVNVGRTAGIDIPTDEEPRCHSARAATSHQRFSARSHATSASLPRHFSGDVDDGRSGALLVPRWVQ